MLSGIVIQARTGSSRLPQKMTLPFFENLSVLEIILKRIKAKYPDYSIILATTTNTSDDQLVHIAQELDIEVLRGSENNVLSRFMDIASKFKLDYMVRICADNPFLDVDHIQTLMDTIENSELDYVSFDFGDGSPTIMSHLGLYTEIVSAKALEHVAQNTTEDIYLEHVTNYIHTMQQAYQVKLLTLPKAIRNNKSIRLTLDTAEDFQLQQIIYKETLGINKHCSLNDLIHHIQNNADYIQQMKLQIELNKK